MITRLEIENFKAIKQLAIDLDPLTVLVGPNDAGKSTILQALELLSRMMDRPLYRDGEPSVFDGDPVEAIHRGDRDQTIRIAVSGTAEDGRALAYGFRAGVDDGRFRIVGEHCTWGTPAFNVWGGSGRFSLPGANREQWTGERSFVRVSYLNHAEVDWARFRRELLSSLFSFEPKKLATPCGPDVTFASSGLGLVALVDRILTDTDRSARDTFERSLRAFSPHLAGVGTRPVTVARPDGPTIQKELIFGLHDKTRVPARDVSSGLLATAGYLALPNLESKRFLIEEPENGVHPHALLQIVDVLRKLAEDGRQVIMTTHSPVLLNYIDAASIRIVTRTAEAGVTVTPATESKVFNQVKQKVDFGALWYSLGDEPLAVAR